MKTIHLVEGPVGAGKSTYCISLASHINGVHIALDQWFVELFSPDRPIQNVVPWYLQRKERLLDHIWTHARRLVESGVTPVLELGLIQRESREEIYNRAVSACIELKVWVLEAPREVRRERVQRRNIEKGATFSMVVTDSIFEIASDMWQSPDETEIIENHIEFVST